ncbi:MAG TPA: SDR family oxidoreductase [Candidatus Omnitrophota bacterium]|nr:SDR family oxidoreductase [Candidatus Omnitrophota bacterium]
MTQAQSPVALITGASRGIGKAIALQLAGQGYSIALNYLSNEQAAKEAADAVKAKGVQAEIFQGNAGEPEACEKLVKDTLTKFGRIDVLVHNAALGSFKPTHKTRLNQWDLTMNINARAMLVLTQAVLKDMEPRGSGNIIGLSSLGAIQYIPNYGAIGVSKATLESLIRYLAVELRPKGIRVNAVSGGPIDTDAIKHFPDAEGFKNACIAKTPAGRIGKAEDLAKVVGFLVSPAAEWIVGQTIIADGGLSLI